MNWPAVLEWFRVPALGMPRYVYFLIVAIGMVNEVVRASKWTRALSIWQGIWALLLWLPLLGWLIKKAPYLGDFSRYLAGQGPAPWKKSPDDDDITPTYPGPVQP